MTLKIAFKLLVHHALCQFSKCSITLTEYDTESNFSMKDGKIIAKIFHIKLSGKRITLFEQL